MPLRSQHRRGNVNPRALICRLVEQHVEDLRDDAERESTEIPHEIRLRRAGANGCHDGVDLAAAFPREAGQLVGDVVREDFRPGTLE